MTHATTHTDAHATIALTHMHCTSCADAIERQLRANPHITHIHLDWVQNVLHVGYHAGMITQADIERLITTTGCDCASDDDHSGHEQAPHKHGANSHAAHASTAQTRMEQLRHGVDVQPIVMGTKYDRMQYEMPATDAHKDHGRHEQRAAAAMDHTAHAAMNHSQMQGMDHNQMQAMDHSAHATMDHNQMQAMDHSSHDMMGHDMSDPGMAAAMERDMRTKFLIALLLTIPDVLYSPIGMNIFGLSLPTFGLSHDLVMLILTTPVVFYCGWMFLAGAYQSLRRRALNMSVLVATGVLAAFIGSLALMLLGQPTFFEAAAMLVTFVLFGHWMEMRSRRGTNDALRALFDLVPPQATIIRDGQEVTLPSSEVQVDDTVLLRPGDKVPVDGTVSEGESSVDESLVTGESVPVSKRPGDLVIAGSINRSGSLRFTATKVGADTTVAQIVELVQRAQNSKAPGQRLADQWAQYLVILAVGAGVLTFAVWMVAGATIALALTFAISAVVIACPDALGLATPTAVAVGTGVAAKHNILIKDAATLENVSRVTAIVLDKTGTLTEGKPALTDIVTVGDVSENDLLRLVASAERNSEHPLAEAIVTGAQQRTLVLTDTTQFDSVAGHGIRATVDWRTLLIGNIKLMRDQGLDATAVEERAAELAEGGKTPMYVAIDGRVAGLIAVADTIKPTAAAAIAGLKAQGIEPIMITGDNARTAAAVARTLGITRFFAEVLPADKAKHVTALQAEGKQVAMVGDGVNDAPALAQANIGIAIGAGTDVAIETASVVLMKSDPLDILRAITISKATVRKMKQNLFWAAIYNVLAIPVAAGVLYPAFGIELRPEWAALLMSLSSIIVALNAVSLMRVDSELEEPGGTAGQAPAQTPAPSAPAV